MASFHLLETYTSCQLTYLVGWRTGRESVALIAGCITSQQLQSSSFQNARLLLVGSQMTVLFKYFLFYTSEKVFKTFLNKITLTNSHRKMTCFLSVLAVKQVLNSGRSGKDGKLGLLLAHSICTLCSVPYPADAFLLCL